MSAPGIGAGGRRRSRREALFLLYQQDVLGLNAEQALERAEPSTEEVRPYTRRLVLGVEQHRDRLDGLLQERLEGWTVSRLGAIERSILRLAAYEILEVEDVETPVAINEAVDLARRYGSHEAARLINGVLGALTE